MTRKYTIMLTVVLFQWWNFINFYFLSFLEIWKIIKK